MDQDANPPGEASGTAKALVKGLAILDLLAANATGMRLTAIVQRSGVPKGTVLRLVDALVAANAVTVDGTGVYRLGPRCAMWGAAFLDSVDIRPIAHEMLSELADMSGETCHLGVLEGLNILYVDKIDGTQAIRMVSRVGGTNPLYCTGVGKAMLPFLPEDQIEAVITGPLEARTENTITDPDVLRREIASIRRRGYAVDDVENEDGVRCVGAPIFDHQDRVVAGISVAGPAYRMTRERIKEFGPLVRNAADGISSRLGWSRPHPQQPNHDPERS